MTGLLDAVEALATPHGLDRYLELVNPMWTVRELRAEVECVHRSTDDSITLTLRPTRQWQGFRAGQFVNVSVDIDGVRRTRCYSPACSQHRRDGRIEITVKAHPQGLVSQYLHAHARRGMVLGLSQADGAFALPSPRPSRVLLVSGGSGITPVLSMLRTLVDEHYDGEIVFLHYAFDEQHVAHLDDLRALDAAHDNVRVVLAYTEQQLGGDLHGLFGHAHLAEAAPWHRDAETYLCGPAPLMQAVREHYDGLGIGHRLHSEDFAPAPLAPLPAQDATGDVTFTRSGTSATNDGGTLLEQAEAAGLRPEFGCRMGICFSCTQVKSSGCTRNVRTGETNSDPDVEVQLCINVPVGDVALDL
ncbi:ferredoxin reductase [Jatrophihabitans endophyticus]|uniref:ferredoxin reductase n=1 Tax=Jatrophihabitans endophyticus TaxID=1206085 RepID=UPI001A00E542|nr:FAD-binding oxidoreductase [Jatrophihabitans endophyticus]MBE7188326.1 ferredoxin reductase [Jatrophihabitans endophyticus]